MIKLTDSVLKFVHLFKHYYIGRELAEETMKVLFIGNSHTYMNDMPELTRRMMR